MNRVIIIGTGVAGLSVARALTPYVDVLMFSKGSVDDGATPLAQGGIAVPIGPADSVHLHVHDTLRAGHFTNDVRTVATVVGDAKNRLNDLLSIGFHPDRNADGSINLALEGGHSLPRVVHSKDHSGKHLHDVLLADVRKHDSVCIMPYSSVESLIQDDAAISGVIAKSTLTHEVRYYTADAVVIATGGIGAVFPTTTNPESATGDGLQLALEVGAQISNLDKIQWHPTALVADGPFDVHDGPPLTHVRMPLITEALRGAGARLVDVNGNDVVPLSMHPQGCLAPRDVVTAACWDSMKETGKSCVYLDATGLDKTELLTKFPGVVHTCMVNGIDPTFQRIPVAPAVHYLCGGITTNINGVTNVEGLYAVGECADTGLHGSNRLASNSLLEGLVMGHRCGLFLNTKHRHHKMEYMVI
ncbi:MAG: FAD-binding protein [Ignavibacteria bacterium]|nr:FAD-binding protein [Ignavibacteria bacterium]